MAAKYGQQQQETDVRKQHIGVLGNGQAGIKVNRSERP
jgi:hypothetical protein